MCRRLLISSPLLSSPLLSSPLVSSRRRQRWPAVASMRPTTWQARAAHRPSPHKSTRMLLAVLCSAQCSLPAVRAMTTTTTTQVQDLGKCTAAPHGTTGPRAGPSPWVVDHGVCVRARVCQRERGVVAVWLGAAHTVWLPERPRCPVEDTGPHTRGRGSGGGRGSGVVPVNLSWRGLRLIRPHGRAALAVCRPHVSAFRGR